MTTTGPGPTGLADRLRRAIEARDGRAFGALLSDDARWGDDDHPKRCRGRDDVVRLLTRGLAEGGRADIVEMATGAGGILCRLRVDWPGQRPGTTLYHVYRVADDRITEIVRFDDRRSAAGAAGVPA